MNRNFLVSVLILVVIIVAIFALSADRKKKSSMEPKTEMEKVDSITKEDGIMGENKESESMIKDEMVKEETSMMKSGTYEAYDMSKLVKAETGNVVLFFRASWCPTCRGLDKDINENLTKIPENLTILYIDYDNSDELKKKYGVTYQHTLVQVDKDGSMIKRWQGSPSLSHLVNQI